MALALSILALLATCYQLYLQRIHNEKSVKPLIQIDLADRNGLIAVYVQNNGLGPCTIEKLSFTKDSEVYHSIRNCISLNPQAYHNIPVTESSKKVILPNSFLDIFSVRLKQEDKEEYIAQIREELSMLKLKVEGKDIYDNKIIIERSLDWFLRHV